MFDSRTDKRTAKRKGGSKGGKAVRDKGGIKREKKREGKEKQKMSHCWFLIYNIIPENQRREDGNQERV